MEYSDNAYDEMIGKLFVRFPSFQTDGGKAFKPGIGNMLFFDQLTGHPHRKYATVHIAGTNGKGSVSNMLASVLAASGLRTGLYTSPHILDFRERMRILDGRSGTGTVEYISKEEVMSFVRKWGSTFDHLDLSFFEITTMMAFDWFAARDVDIAVIETGLGGRFDSTNIISPVLSIITNIGLDHCDMLGHTLGEIAFEKAGIIKPGVPVTVGEEDPETGPVFEKKVLYTNLPDPEYMGDAGRIMSLLKYAGRTVPSLWADSGRILSGMDLQGAYQEKNLRTVCVSLDVLSEEGAVKKCPALEGLRRMMLSDREAVEDALMRTASRMDFHGRWERLCTDPAVIADIGHNAHGLRYNFRQLRDMQEKGDCTHLIIVYGIVSDKDVSAVFPLMPHDAVYVFTNSSGRRSLPASSLLEQYLSWCAAAGKVPAPAEAAGTVADAVARAFTLARETGRQAPGARPLIYIGGSTFVVSEALGPVEAWKSGTV